MSDPTSERVSPTPPWRTSPVASTNCPLRVLLAEDDDDMRELVADALRRDGYEVVAVPDGGRLLVSIGRSYASGRAHQDYDLIVADIRMPVCDGLQILEELRKAAWPTPTILMTSYDDASTRARADALGAVLFSKPFDTDDLRTAARNLTCFRGRPPT